MKTRKQKNQLKLPSIVIVFGLLLLLNSCASPSSQGKGGGGWVSVVIGVLLLLGLIGLVIYLWRTGKLGAWYSAGSNAARLKSQDVRLKGELRALEREWDALLDELGESAWAARVSDPAYESEYKQLLTLQGQIDGAGDYRQTLEEKKIELTKQHQEVSERFGQQLDSLKNRQADVERNLTEAKNRVRALEADLDATAQEKARFQRDVKETRSRIIELERSDDPGIAEQLAQLNSRLSSLTTSLLDATNAEPDLAAQLPGLQNQALALNTELNSLLGRIQTLEGDRDREIMPLEDQLEALEKQIRNKNSDIRSFEEQLKPLAKALGKHVESVRPLSPELTEIYQKLDMVAGKIEYKTEKRGDITSSLEEVDKTASLSFYGLILVGVLVIALAVLLLTGVI